MNIKEFEERGYIVEARVIARDYGIVDLEDGGAFYPYEDEADELEFVEYRIRDEQGDVVAVFKDEDENKIEEHLMQYIENMEG